MIKLPYGQKLCKIGKVPFQGFRWKAGPGGRYKETIISAVIAKERNICQACLNDLQFGLPVGVRDSLLKDQHQAQLALPQSEVGAMYRYDQLAHAQEGSGPGGGGGVAADSVNFNNASQANQLAQFSHLKSAPDRSSSATAFRNLPKLCSFWLQGTCNRSKRGCPYRPCCGIFLFPELASTHQDQMRSLIADLESRGADAVQRNLSAEIRDLFRQKLKGRSADEGIKKRVAGEDSLTQTYLGKIKMMVRLPLSPILSLLQRSEVTAPADSTITTLWVGGVESNIESADLMDIFYAFGHVVSLRLVPASRSLSHSVLPCPHCSRCAFVQYAERSQAEYAARQLQGSLTVKGRPLTLTWAQAHHPSDSSSSLSSVDAASVPQQRVASGRGEDSAIPLPPGISQASDLPPHLRPGGS
jgi:pre-mRNA-splicing factor RBM22/SLT11